MGERAGIVDFALGLRFDPDLLQRIRLMLEFHFARGKVADAEYVGHDLGILLASQFSRAIRRHGGTNPLKKIACRQTIPVGGELSASERRRGLSAAEGAPMARGAVSCINSGAAFRLRRGVDAVPD